MTTTATARTADHDLASRVLPLGVATFVVAGVWTVLGAHGWQEWVTMIALQAAVAGLVYGRVLPRALARPSAPGTALTLSIVAAVLTVPAFWSGLPLVLGAAGALVGYAGRRASQGAGRCLTAMALGLLAVIGYLAIYIVDGVVLGNLV